ncbi:aminoacyl-histidine dipeptidase [Oribacterium sp. P6A1]|uniref:aminoacyl-histidine dipeptidase n=1 Tax=Oribacterium sp. P6A1 TaxID=1410612 RepID=UPI00055C9038|nr:aminoacyl-histidine dipeptidase [Oribacterium sp. P6A1]
MGVLSNLEPKEVFGYFEEICGIPHGSGNTQAISDYLVKFAMDHKLRFRQDEAGNVVIFKPATEGYENADTVMLQGHMDMVAEQDPDCTKDMMTEGLDLFVDGDLVGARGTTLGGDDGIAVAMELAILASHEAEHPDLECVFTVGEEIGMVGARALDTSDLKAKYMLNLDSEADGIFTVSCAGAARVVVRFSGGRETLAGKALKLTVGGLAGGHSGEEIHKGRANADIVLGRAMFEISRKTELRLVEASGGTKDNAIPRESSAIIAVSDVKAAEEAVSELNHNLGNEYRVTDSGVWVKLEPAEAEAGFSRELSERIVCFMFTVPNGVQVMSADVEGLVQTSTNLGQIYTEEDSVYFSFLTRSSVNSQRDETVERIEALAAALGGEAEVGSAYSAWEYKADSKLRDTMIEAYKALNGREPKVEALHAGLECGILSGKMPGLDAVSIGPDLTDIHTPRERLHIESTGRIYKLTIETLKRLR